MLESEAKKKWCPFSRHVLDSVSAGYPVGNRFVGVGDMGQKANSHCLCLGSDCACWAVEDGGEKDYADYGHCGLKDAE